MSHTPYLHDLLVCVKEACLDLVKTFTASKQVCAAVTLHCFQGNALWVARVVSILKGGKNEVAVVVCTLE